MKKVIKIEICIDDEYCTTSHNYITDEEIESLKPLIDIINKNKGKWDFSYNSYKEIPRNTFIFFDNCLPEYDIIDGDIIINTIEVYEETNLIKLK